MFNNTITITIKCCYILSGGEWFQFFPGQRMLSRLFPHYVDWSMLLICWYANMCWYADMVPLCWYIFHRTENADCCPDYYPHCLGADDSQWVNINVIVILMIVVIIIIITIHHYFLPFSLGPIPKNYWGVTQDDDISANARDVHDDDDYHNDYNIMI